jgi:hypothetical protein
MNTKRVSAFFLVTASLAAMAVVGVSAATAADPRHSFIQNVDVRPAQFNWAASVGSGHSVGIGWRHWGTRRAVGFGRSQLCLSPAAGGACSPLREARITASKRRRFDGPEGEDYYVYCRVMFRGHLDPADASRVIDVAMLIEPEYPCD